MVIVNNQLQVAKIKLAYILSFFMGIGFLIPLFVVTYLNMEYYILFGLGIILILIFGYLVIIKPEYLYLLHIKGNLQIKNYPARPIFRQYKAFELKLNSLHHFEIHRSFFNKKVSLIIWVKTKKGIGSFPAISLSALSKNEQLKLTKYLSENSIDRKKNIIPY